MAQLVKDLVLSLPWLVLLLWCVFNPWIELPNAENFHMLWGHPKKKKKSVTSELIQETDSWTLGTDLWLTRRRELEMDGMGGWD